MGSIVESGDIRSISLNPDDDEQYDDDDDDDDDDDSDVVGDRICSMADDTRTGRKSGFEISGWKNNRSTLSSIKLPGRSVSMVRVQSGTPEMTRTNIINSNI